MQLNKMRLEISNLRALRGMLNPAGRSISAVGANRCSGTSVLEGIYLAGLRKFPAQSRSADSEWRRPVRRWLFISCRGNGAGEYSGAAQREKSTVCRMDGNDLSSDGRRRHCRCNGRITAAIFLEHGPDVRRQFLDMGLFRLGLRLPAPLVGNRKGTQGSWNATRSPQR